MKAFAGFFLLDDVKNTVKLLFDPFNKLRTSVTTIRPDLFDAIHDGEQGGPDVASGTAIVNIGRMSRHNNEITHGIYYNMPFAALDQFTAIEPRFPDGFRGPLDGLATDNPGARIPVPTDFFPELLVNRRVDLT